MMLRNTIQHYLYHKQQELNEISKLVKLLTVCVYVLIPFQIVEIIREYNFPDKEFFLSFMFWAVVILLIVYWIPNKKEFREWMKKNHSTF